MRKISLFCIFLPILLFIISCEGDKTTIETTLWEPDGIGFRQFKTNDSQYMGYTFWYWVNDSYEPTMSSCESYVMKMSGCTDSGSGIVFCLQDSENFYALFIDTTGYYLVYKRVDGTWVGPIIDWSFTSQLKTGYEQENYIRVVHDDGQDKFEFTFSLDPGAETFSFTDSSFSGGYSGYICWVSDDGCEKFPKKAVDVRFKMIYPVNDP